MKRAVWAVAISLIGMGPYVCAWSADAQLNLNLLSIQGARVKRPYVAVWVEKAGSHAFAANVAVWYDMDKPGGRGTKWLPDLRAWWQAIGSQVSMPIDGVSGATRPAGEQVINLGDSGALQKLSAGDYEVVVEVTREHGGYDLVRLPLQWPPRSAVRKEATGTQELGAVSLSVKP